MVEIKYQSAIYFKKLEVERNVHFYNLFYSIYFDYSYLIQIFLFNYKKCINFLIAPVKELTSFVFEILKFLTSVTVPFTFFLI